MKQLDQWKWTAEIRPGQNILLLFMPLVNTTEDDIVIKEVVPASDRGIPEVASVVRVELGPRGSFTKNPGIPLGAYVTYPPASMSVSGCAVQELVSPLNYRLPPTVYPEDRALIATWLRAESAGEAAIERFRVTYEQEGRTFVQDVPLTIEVEVKDGADKWGLTSDQRLCADLARPLS